MSVATLFDEVAQRYDRDRRQLVPCFDEFYGTVLDLIPYGREDRIRVLDLGAGTGLLSAIIAGAFPRSRLTLVDAAGEMLHEARRRFADEAKDRFRFCVMDYAKGSLNGEYEVVVSALSIHHLEGEEKRELFGQVYGVIRDGGAFINADQALGETPEIEARYREAWLRQVRERGVSEPDLSAALLRMKEDKMSTLDEQLAWLEDAGFVEVDRAYKNHSFAVYGGRKRGLMQVGGLLR